MQRLLPSWRQRKCALLAISCVSSHSFGFHYSHSTSESHSRQELTRMHSSTICSTIGDDKNFTVAIFPCLNDNYGFLLHSEGTGETAAIDTPEVTAYNSVLERYGWTLTHIFNTHHHGDHTGGNLKLKTEGVKVYGPREEANKIPGIDVQVEGGDEFIFGTSTCKVLNVGGHTLGHIAYHFPTSNVVFVGDSLFSLGCGRMFEGTPEQFWASLKRLRELPDETYVYCAHEYTESNAKFAASIEPGNSDLLARIEEVKSLRAKGDPSIPSLMGVEKKTNPFLRVDVSDEIRANCGVSEADSCADAFAKVRKAKDRF